MASSCVQLVERARGGDLAAFGELLSPHQQKGVATGFFDPQGAHGRWGSGPRCVADGF